MIMKEQALIGIIRQLCIYILVVVCSINIQAQQKNKIFGSSVPEFGEDPQTGYIRCATVEYEKYLQNKEGKRLSDSEFEKWIAPKAKNMKRLLSTGKTDGEVFIIPVVVHVVHNGTVVGEGANISDERVISQITVLNQDYRKMLNTRGYNDNPVGADMEIEFRLAKVDPYGKETNGINRVQIPGYVWNSSNIENVLKPRTQWDPEKYFNIWVCEFGGDLDRTLGYAQFPANSGLQGMEAPFTANTDGVIIRWSAFGTSDIVSGSYSSPYDKGRTLTHEIGHALGLRHIWGDNSSCIVDETDSYNDYCLDTPASSQANYYCTQIVDSCPSDPGNDMTENYMDYTNDTCMNTFTEDQKARILTVLTNSPRRVNLTKSEVWKSGTETNDTHEDIYIYPNPAKENLEVRIPDAEETALSYKIYNSVGQIMAKNEEVNAKSGFRIITSSFEPGIYVLKLSTDKRNKKIRFMVIR